MKIPFFQHDLGRPELDAVTEVLAGPLLTTGDAVRTFERRFADHLGCREVLAVSSCTGALHLSLLALGIGPGDEVITTPMTFIATATAVIEAGATPVFVDVEQDTGLLDPARVEAAINERTRAIIPVHLYGQMCDMRALRALAVRHGLHLIEDSAHCIEGMRDDIRPGQLGDTACFSFYATKNLTCGEGGAIATNDEDLARRLRLLHLHGMTRTAADRMREGYSHWDMTVLGWKYNMDNIHAALLLPQMGRLELSWAKRSALARRYEALLADVPDVERPATRPAVHHAHHLFPIWLSPGQRDAVISELNERGVGVVVNYRAIHLLTWFRERFHFKRGDFPNAELIGDRTLSLPLYPAMPVDHVEKVVTALHSILRTPQRLAA